MPRPHNIVGSGNEDCDVCRLPKWDVIVVRDTDYVAQKIRTALRRHGKLIWRDGDFKICGDCMHYVNDQPWLPADYRRF